MSVSVPAKRKAGRKRVGDVRCQFMIPRIVFARLLEREKATGISHTRIAADILFKALMGS